MASKTIWGAPHDFVRFPRDLPSGQRTFTLSLQVCLQFRAESAIGIVTLLLYLNKKSHCMYISLAFSLKISKFVGNFALFHVVVLFFLYLFSFSQENENTQRYASVTTSAMTHPELWRLTNRKYLLIYCVDRLETQREHTLSISVCHCERIFKTRLKLFPWKK